jgi:hypothetical protein
MSEADDLCPVEIDEKHHQTRDEGLHHDARGRVHTSHIADGHHAEDIAVQFVLCALDCAVDMDMRMAQVRRAMEKRYRNMGSKRKKATVSTPILSTSLGFFVFTKGIQSKRLSDIRGGHLSPTWYLTFGS